MNTLDCPEDIMPLLVDEWESRRAEAARSATYQPNIGQVIYIDLTAPTNQSGNSYLEPRNTLVGFYLTSGATTFLFCGGREHNIEYATAFTNGANFSIATTSGKADILIGSYDPRTGERVWDERRVATLVSSETLTTPAQPHAGRPIIYINQSGAKGKAIVSGIRMRNPRSATSSYDAVHIVGTDSSSTIIMEHVYAADFPEAALDPVGGAVYAKVFSVDGSGNPNITMRFLRVGNIWADGIWISRGATGGVIRIEWCDLRLNGEKQSIAGPDCIQLQRAAGTTNFGQVMIENNLMHNPRNEKQIIFVNDSNGISGHSLTLRGNIMIGVDSTVTPISGSTPSGQPTVYVPQYGLNLEMDNVTIEGNFIMGTLMPIKAKNACRVRGNVILRICAGVVVPGTNWQTGIQILGTGVVVDRNTVVAIGTSGGSALYVGSGSAGFARNNVIVGSWGVGIQYQTPPSASLSVSGTVLQITESKAAVRLILDAFGRPVRGGSVATAAAVLDDGPTIDFLGSFQAIPAPALVGAMQCYAPDL